MVCPARWRPTSRASSGLPASSFGDQMSKFFKALEQAERDRALHQQAVRAGAAAAPQAPAQPEAEPVEPVTAPIPPAAQSSPAVSRTRVQDAPAVVPVLPDAPSGMDSHLVSLLSPGAHEAEPYRALRHLVEQRRQITGLGVLVVTSPGMGDGKTTTAINLAGALAQDAKARVLIIEADLRKPTLAARLGLDGAGRSGLAGAILDTRLALDAVVESCPPFNLDIVPAGHSQGAPYELLASPRFGE